MKKRYCKIIRNYFSDYVSWLLLVSVIFVISLVTVIVFDAPNKFIWPIPVLFLLIYLQSIPLLAFYCKVSKELRAGDIEILTIKILEIQSDDRFTFKNSGGSLVGRKKYRIIDENHNTYLLSASKDEDVCMMFKPYPTFEIEVDVLKKSRFVLSMKIIDNPKTIKGAREQRQNIKYFKKIFNHYF